MHSTHTLSRLELSFSFKDTDAYCRVRFTEIQGGVKVTQKLRETFPRVGGSVRWSAHLKDGSDVDLASVRHRLYGLEDPSDILLLAGRDEVSAFAICPVQLESWQGALIFPLWHDSPIDSALVSARFQCTSAIVGRTWWSLRAHSDPFWDNARVPLSWWLPRLEFHEPSRWRIVL